MEDNNKLDDLFGNKLRDGEAEVPAGSWQSIQQRIGAMSLTDKPKRKFFVVPFVWIGISFLSGALVGALALYSMKLKSENRLLVELMQEKDKNWELATCLDEWEKKEKVATWPYSLGKGRSSESSFLISTMPLKNTGRDKRTQTSSKKIISLRKSYQNQLAEWGTEGNQEDFPAIPNVKDEYHGGTKSPIPNFSTTLDSPDSTKHAEREKLLAQLDSLKTLTLVQKEKQENKGQKEAKLLGYPFSLGFYLSPEMASRSVHYNQNPDPQLVKYKENDKAVLGFSSGISLTLHLPKQLYIRTGLNYWNIGDKNYTVLQNQKQDTVKENVQGIPASGVKLYVYDSTSSSYNSFTGTGSVYDPTHPVPVFKDHISQSVSQYASSVQNNYQYLGIPLLLGIKLGKSALRLGAYSGVIFNVLVSPKKAMYYVYYEGGTSPHYIQSTRELTRFSMVYWGGLDIDLQLAKNWSVTLSPTLKYSLTSIYKGEQSLKQLPYALGVQLGVNYRIK